MEKLQKEVIAACHLRRLWLRSRTKHVLKGQDLYGVDSIGLQVATFVPAMSLKVISTNEEKHNGQ
jgi:hypothetical protein